MGTELDCSNQLSQNDIRMIYRKCWTIFCCGQFNFKWNSFFSTELGSLDRAGLITEIRRLYDEGYQLGLEEAKEITRGKYLNIFTSSNNRKAK